MKIINFEGLGLSLKINSLLLNINGVKIYWYAFIIVISVIIAILLCKKDDGKYHIKFDDILTLLIFLIPISIICARMYFVIFKFEYYMKNPIEIFNIRNGGLAIYGGIIGAIITIMLFCRKYKILFLDMLDYLAPYLAIRAINWKMGEFFQL